MITPINRRARFRIGLSPVYLPYYDSLCRELPETWQPISGLRSFAEQNALYAQGRTMLGSIVTKAKGGMSFHNYGMASDWSYFPEGKYTCPLASDPVWKEYIDAIERVGLQWINWERPHNQLKIPVPVQRLYMVYLAKGQAAVEEYVGGLLNGSHT